MLEEPLRTLLGVLEESGRVFLHFETKEASGEHTPCQIYTSTYETQPTQIGEGPW
jgi:hypothetical protein